MTKYYTNNDTVLYNLVCSRSRCSSASSFVTDPPRFGAALLWESDVLGVLAKAEFGFGDPGLSLAGLEVGGTTPLAQADRCGVKCGWRLLEVDGIQADTPQVARNALHFARRSLRDLKATEAQLW